MRGRGIYAAFCFWRWLLPVVMSFAIVVSTSMPFGAGSAAQQAMLEYGQHDLMSGHGMPDHKSSGDHKIHPLCGPGAGCFAFTIAETSTTIGIPAVHTVNAVLTVVLSTRSIAPPLPPPISFIIA